MERIPLHLLGQSCDKVFSPEEQAFAVETIFCSVDPFLPSHSCESNFLNLPPKNLVRFLQAKPVEMWLPVPPYCSPKEFLTLIDNTQPPAIHQNYTLVVPAGVWLQRLLFQAVDLSCGSPCAPPELLEGEFSLLFQFSSGSRKKITLISKLFITQ